jgi:hypothetical protein
MTLKNPVISSLNPRYFWDVDIKKLDESSSARLIVERIFMLGEIDEMNLLINHYSREKVVEILTNLPYLDPKTLNFVSKLFDKPLKSFKCYRSKQSKPQHWNS